jgi:hypothetical protein
MRKWELCSAATGTLGGAVISVAVAYLFDIASTLWLPAIIGALTGLAGGALGQNFIEGIVVAAISTVMLALLLSLKIGWPINEITVGFFCGSAFGWLTHGICRLRS